MRILSQRLLLGLGLLVLVTTEQGYAQQAPSAADHTLPFVADQRWAVVQDVVVEGNRKTRRDIVLREMDLLPGDTLHLHELDEVLARQRLLLLNTNLFSEAEVLVSRLDTVTQRVLLRAVVREKWYFYPAVDFDLADRNFNIWWTEQNRSLDRVNYGVKLRHGNTTGRADRLTLFAQGGYTRKAELKYEIPYVNRAKTYGLEFSLLAGRNREWGAATRAARLIFLDLDSIFVLERRRFRAGIVFRPGIFAEHLVRLERQTNRVDAKLGRAFNPEFFGDGRVRQEFWGLRYQYVHDRRDQRPFPIRGFYLRSSLEKLGLGNEGDLNRLNLEQLLRYYQPISPRWSASIEVSGKTDLVRTPVPFYNRSSLGFDNNFVRGYQLYVVDGLDWAYLRNTLRYKVFERDVRLPFAPIQRLRRIPFKLFVAATADAGGARDPFDTPGNVLANRVLSSYGVGVYAVVFYGKVIRFEVTRNDLNETGVFLSYSLGF